MEKLINNIKNREYKFINSQDFVIFIKNTIKTFFPSLIEADINILEILTIFMIDHISFKYSFDNQNEMYYSQWEQNNGGDIKGVVLLLLPFINDNLLKDLTNLNHLLYSKDDNINKDILNYEREKILSTHFKYGNMGLGLINERSKNEILLNLAQDDKLIYQIIIDNFYGLLQTLDIINGKSYINWINIQPLNINNYSESNLYKNTRNYITQLSLNEEIINSIDLNYNGLWLGDIYNTLRVKYYEEAKKIKWLIYPYEFSENKSDCKYLINILNELLDLESIINNKFNNYKDLDITEQIEFKNKLNIILTNYLDSKYSDVIKYMLLWFKNNYSGKYNINAKELLFLNLKNFDDIEENENDIGYINGINQEDLYNGFEYIIKKYISDLWNFLRESIELFISSAYSKFILIKENNEYIITDYYYYKPFFNKNIEMEYLNLKNIYNISKSLCHDIEKWKTYDRNYISLNYINRFDFFSKLCNIGMPPEIGNRWFSYKQNYKKQFKYKTFFDKIEINNYEDAILGEFRNIFLRLVFEELIFSGILNEFKPNPQITDKTKLPSDTILLQKKRKENVKKLFNDNKNKWLESYYYLSNDKFKNINKFRVAKRPILNEFDKYEEKIYFDVIVDSQEWITFYAMNWISQINFFHHYIFHQIIFVTGATGQGKSTQVPKLLLYVSKMYDYNSKPNIICTQPRIQPTVDNATRIAEELGFPLEQITNKSNYKIKTDNYYVQYKYDGGEHSKRKTNHPVLKIVTDGTLLETIIPNPVMKYIKNTEEYDKENKKTIKKDKFINENIYDIIIVDEAHEHNINMDIILTLSKQTCYLNNQIKLIIVSATMDDDEPIYRRYYKSINDKLVYPIKSMIKEPFFMDEILLNPIYMDRRYHISPPGETTQYKVTEIYLDKNIEKDTIEEISKESQKIGYKKVIEICNKTVSGEILFFCNGRNEILEAVEYLNNFMPPGNIALPFFSEMNQMYKDIITKINSKIYNIKNKRENIHEEWGAKYIEDDTVSDGLYKRAIIIATNIAEASVTIPGLMYIIDNGYSKVNIYNPILNINKLKVVEISEASRIQRKGRVGRVSDGTIYYMYKKDARKNNKPQYKITQQDITDFLLKLTTDFNLDEYLKDDKLYKYSKYIISEFLNPNIYKFGKGGDYFISNTGKKIDHSDVMYVYKSELFRIYIENYRINDDYLSKNYYDTTGMESSYLINYDGNLFENLLDINGNFYLIHPFENDIKRNVINKIISINNQKNNKIDDIYYKHILNPLKNRNLIVNINNEYVKTELSSKILKLMKDFELVKINDAIILISASAMGCLDEINEVMIFLKILNNSLHNLADPNIGWDRFRIFNNNINVSSDILFIYDIINKIKRKFDKSKIFNYEKHRKIINTTINNIIDKKINEFKEFSKKYNEPQDSKYDGSIWNKLKNLEINGSLNSDKRNIFLNESEIINSIIDDINNDDIIKWAEFNCLNPNVIIKFIKDLSYYYVKNNNNDVLEWSKNLSSNFNNCLTDNTIEEKILRSFVYGYPMQITFNEDNIIRSIINNNKYNIIYQIPPNSFKKLNCTVSSVDDFYFYYLFEEVERADNKTEPVIKVSLINKIKPEWLIPTMPFLYNKEFNNVYKKDKESGNINSYTINKLHKEFTNKWHNKHIIWNSNHVPILEYYYKKLK